LRGIPKLSCGYKIEDRRSNKGSDGDEQFPHCDLLPLAPRKGVGQRNDLSRSQGIGIV
jgi:hypothetical protein